MPPMPHTHSIRYNIISTLYCTVLENIHTPPTKGIGISQRMGASVRQKNTEIYQAHLEFPEG